MKIANRSSVCALALLALGLVACQGRDPEAWISEALARSGGEPGLLSEELFASGCASCHGRSGRGDGPLAVELGALPPDFTDSVWQRSVGDERIERAIRGGGEAVGVTSYMPAFPELAPHPEMLVELRQYIRRFRREDLE